ncbi:MAG: hypothetical protein KAG18_01965, partial [Sinobacterium sp.]|nr:hypothetical protein [Sinobacterium sp.]
LNTASINLIQAVLIGTQQDYDNAKLGGDKYPLTPMFLSDDEQKEVQMAQGYLPREEGGIGLVSQGWATDEEAVSYFAENFNNALLWPTDKLVLGSEYFLLLSTGKLADVNVYLESVISRDNDTMKVIARSTGGL